MHNYISRQAGNSGIIAVNCSIVISKLTLTVCKINTSRSYYLIVYLLMFFYWLESLKKKAQKSKEALNDCVQHTRSIEIHFQEEGCKPLLSKVHFPFDDSVSVCVCVCVCVHVCLQHLLIKNVVCRNCKHFNILSKCAHLTVKNNCVFYICIICMYM